MSLAWGGGSLYSEVPCRGGGEAELWLGLGRRDLYSEIQCIMGNGHMGTPHVNRMTDRHDWKHRWWVVTTRENKDETHTDLSDMGSAGDDGNALRKSLSGALAPFSLSRDIRLRRGNVDCCTFFVFFLFLWPWDPSGFEWRGRFFKVKVTSFWFSFKAWTSFSWLHPTCNRKC